MSTDINITLPKLEANADQAGIEFMLHTLFVGTSWLHSVTNAECIKVRQFDLLNPFSPSDKLGLRDLVKFEYGKNKK